MQNCDNSLKTFTILLDGGLKPAPRLLGQVSGSQAIAADGGMRHAKPLGLMPILWLGDFDSAEKTLHKEYAAVPKLHFPRAKDRSDGELAAEAALERGAEKLILCGAFGGARLDHALLHMTLAVAFARKGIDCLLTDGETEGYPLIKGDYCFDLPLNSKFSVIAFADMENVTIHGARWNIDSRKIPFGIGASLALSNESRGAVHISLNSGYGILLAQPNL